MSEETITDDLNVPNREIVEEQESNEFATNVNSPNVSLLKGFKESYRKRVNAHISLGLNKKIFSK